MDLTLLSTTIVKHQVYDGKLYTFTDKGLDVHDLATGTRLAWADLSFAAPISTGAVNDDGAWISPTNGVYLLTHAEIAVGGSVSSSASYKFGAGSTPSIVTNDVRDIDGKGSALLMATAAGAVYLPDQATVYKTTITNGCAACALGPSDIAYALSDGEMRVAPIPTADWTSGAETALSTGSSPAILSDTVNGLAYGTDLFIATALGPCGYDGSAVTDWDTDIGTVKDTKTVSVTPAATVTEGLLAYGTSNGADGGESGILDLALI